MKTLYCCEHCLKQFADYEAAIACEESHLTDIDVLPPAMVDMINDDKSYSYMRTEYKPGKRMPSVISLRACSGYDESGNRVYHYAVYKMDSSLSDGEAETLNKDYEAFCEKRQEESRRYWQEYQARREAEKAAKEAAENAAE